MGKRFQPWLARIKSSPWWLMGAIASVLLWIGGDPVRPELSRQLEDGRLSNPENVTPRQTLISGIGAIAVAGGVLLVLVCRSAPRNSGTANLSGAAFQGANFRGVNLSGADFCGADLNGADFCGANLNGANLGGADLNRANLGGANLNRANLSGANLISANLSGANLSDAEFRYANLSGANFRYTNLSRADLRYANLSGADLNCTLLSDANLSEANLSGALLFFINLREVLNLEPLQLETKPLPLLCHVALPTYAQQPKLNPNRACDRLPQLLSNRYHISLEEAQGIVREARQHPWN